MKGYITKEQLSDNLKNELSEFGSQLEHNAEKISVLGENTIFLSNKKAFQPNVYGNPSCTSTNKEYLLNELKLLKRTGIKEIIITVRTHLNSDGVTIDMTQDIDTLLYIYDQAKILGLKTYALRMSASSYHNNGYDFNANWNTWSVKYKEILTKVLKSFEGKGIENFIVFNETERIYCDLQKPFTANPYINSGTQKETFVLSCINACKLQGYNVSISPASLRYLNFVTDAIMENSDFICFNFYPQIGSNGNNLSLHNAVLSVDRLLDNALTNIKDKYPGKKIIITECGVLPYWEALMSPSAWDFAGYEKDLEGNPVNYFWEVIFNSSLKSKVDGIAIWFHEAFVESNIELIRNYIGGGL